MGWEKGIQKKPCTNVIVLFHAEQTTKEVFLYMCVIFVLVCVAGYLKDKG